MNIDVNFYKDGRLKNYDRISKEELEEIMQTYQVEKKPEHFNIVPRLLPYFVHDVEKFQEDYKNTSPYYLEGTTTVVKTSTGEKGYVELSDLMQEKDMCRELWFSSYYGKASYPFDIIDIQVPLKNKQKDNYGEIDNIGIDEKESGEFVVYLIEAKPLGTNETLLRAITEAITYRYHIEENRKQFLDNLKEFVKTYHGKGKKVLKLKEKLNHGEEVSIGIKSLVLVPKKLYEDHEYSKILYEHYKEDIEFYHFEFTINDLEYHNKDERVASLFKENSYPRIKKI